MAGIPHNDHDTDDLVQCLTSGFKSLLEEVQLMALRNANLEQRLVDAQEQVCFMSPSHGFYILHDETTLALDLELL